MPRILAIDYGTVRTGFAVTDPEQIIAQGLETVRTGKALDFIKEYLEKEQVVLFVVGEPLELNNNPSPVSTDIEKFIRQLQGLFPGIPVGRMDERFTTSIARQTVIGSGAKKKTRRDKGLYDKISATIILQSWMEQNKRADLKP